MVELPSVGRIVDDLVARKGLTISFLFAGTLLISAAVTLLFNELKRTEPASESSSRDEYEEMLGI